MTLLHRLRRLLGVHLLLPVLACSLTACWSNATTKIRHGSPEVFRVVVEGNGYARRSTVELLAAREAARHAQSLGAKYFVVFSSASSRGSTWIPQEYPTEIELSRHKADGQGSPLPLVDRGRPVSTSDNPYTWFQFATIVPLLVTPASFPLSSLLIDTSPEAPRHARHYYEPQQVLDTIARIAPGLAKYEAAKVVRGD